MNFNNCPICNLELIEFAVYKRSFVCKNKHIIGLFNNEATVRLDDIGFSLIRNKVYFMYLEKPQELKFKLSNGEEINLYTVTVSKHIEIDFYPDLTDIPKLVKRVKMLKIFS